MEEQKFKINDFVRHTETSEVYKVVGVSIGKYQFFYKLETDEKISIETLYPQSILELEINDKTTN